MLPTERSEAGGERVMHPHDTNHQIRIQMHAVKPTELLMLESGD